MNKSQLEKIIDEIMYDGVFSDIWRGYISEFETGGLEGETTVELRELLINKFIEYARSVVLPLSIDQNYNLSHMPEIVGYNLCLDHINARINQDSQLLTDKE